MRISYFVTLRNKILYLRLMLNIVKPLLSNKIINLNKFHTSFLELLKSDRILLNIFLNKIHSTNFYENSINILIIQIEIIIIILSF